MLVNQQHLLKNAIVITNKRRKKDYGGLGHHYGGRTGCGYENISIQIIDQVEQGDAESLADCEVYWQHQLRCYVENGGNGHCYKKEKAKFASR